MLRTNVMRDVIVIVSGTMAQMGMKGKVIYNNWKLHHSDLSTNIVWQFPWIPLLLNMTSLIRLSKQDSTRCNCDGEKVDLSSVADLPPFYSCCVFSYLSKGLQNYRIRRRILLSFCLRTLPNFKLGITWHT